MNCQEIIKAIGENGHLDHVIQGASMMPLLNAKRGDTVRLCRLPSQIRRFDIVLFLSPNDRMVLHRVLSIKDDRLYIRGDNCYSGEWVPKNRLIAFAEGVTRKGRFISAGSIRYRSFGILGILSYPWRNLRHLIGKTVRKIGSKKHQPKTTPPKEFDALICLTKSAINGQAAPELPDNTDYALLDIIAKRHSLSALTFPYLPKANIPDDVYELWKKRQGVALKRTILFEQEWKNIAEHFEKNGIDYLPLKGMIINHWYPFGGREFTDYDVLIRPGDEVIIDKIMSALGYNSIPSSRVNEYEKMPIFHFEFHKYLLDGDEFGGRFFPDIWEKAIPNTVGHHAYRLSDEDLFVYQLAHVFHHYKCGGIGLRHLADIYMMKRHLLNLPDFSFDKVSLMLSAYRLSDFYTLVDDMTESLFGTSEKPISPDLFMFIYRSGTSGLMEFSVRQKISSQGTFRFFLSHMFPRYANMKKKYPLLGKAPILLPLFWFIRIGSFIANPYQRKAILNGLRHRNSST